MTGSLPPKRLQELTTGYVLGDLSAEEAEEFRRLLMENSDLATEVSRLQEVLGLIPYALPEVEPPLRLRSAILEAAHAGVKRPKQFSFGWIKVVGSVAALLVLALGLDNYRLRQNLTTTQVQVAQQKELIAMLQQPSIHLVSLKGADLAPAASGSFVMNPIKEGAFLAIQNLPPLPADQTYQLYSVVNGKRIAWGRFNAGPKGTVLVKLPIPPKAKVSNLVVTLQSSPVSTRSVGPTVMTSEL